MQSQFPRLVRAMSTLTEVSKVKSFGGWQKVFSHESSELKCKMNFGVYLPPQAETSKVPVLYFLSGLTCTEQNFITKSGFQNYAAKHGICVVNPDTSPRGCNVEGEEDGWDFGTGAGFYVDATEEKWKTNYRMYSYVTKELPELIKANFPINPDKKSITGHSMGGHGAISIFLKNPGMYSAVSAFSPICNPIECPWGQKAFAGYLGDNKDTWKEHDSCHLLKKYTGPKTEILIYQGAADNFLTAGQLLPDHLVAAGAEAGVPVKLHLEEGYDHSYFFIASFIEETFNHHAKYLKA